MSGIKRRDFMAAMAGTAICLNGFGRRLRADSSIVAPPPQVPLGTTGITMSRVGHGTGMHGGNRQSNHTRMGFEKLVALLRHSYERGVTFFDLADLYGSHIYLREALRSIPREKISILTKLWWRYDGEPGSTPVEFQKKSTDMAIQRFRHEIATDHLDIVLLHCLMNPEWPGEMQGYMDALSEAKSKGHVKAVGVSCHDFGALKTAVKLPWVDVILARINPKGAKMDAPTDQVVPVLEEAKKNGKAIIGMKIYGEGTLSHMKDECVRFAQNLGLLDAMTVGAEKPEQMDETLGLIAKHPAAKVG